MLSTHHHLCGKHVLVPQLEVPHSLQDHLQVLPRLEEVCASENCGIARGLVPFHVDGVWLVVGIDTPGRKNTVVPPPPREAWRSCQADHQRGLGATVVAAASVRGCVPQTRPFGGSLAQERGEEVVTCAQYFLLGQLFTRQPGFRSRQAWAVLEGRERKEK